MLWISYTFFILLIKVQGADNVAYPTFPREAEFLLESLINDGQHRRILFECVYDYPHNRLILIDDRSQEVSNYTTLRKAIYSFKHCEVYPIDRDNPLDGFSAMTNAHDQTTHIRTLEDFFLFTSNASYLGESILRGFIHVQQWRTSISDDSEVIWSFATSNYSMSWKAENFSIPIQRIIRRKDDGLILQVLNIFNYQTKLTKKNFTPPQGIFCSDFIPKDELRSLQDVGMIFPKKFRVRIDASTTSEQLWQSVHLHYHATENRKLIRYDYTPTDNPFDPVTIILDISSDGSRSYQIDRRIGSCIINELSEIVLMSSVLHNPIETLIKYEEFLLANPAKGVFQYTGQRACRGSIMCEIYIGQLARFPSDPEEDWLSSNIEWAWSKHEHTGRFDYPVYLDWNLYRDIDGLPVNLHYEFYDYQSNVYVNEFDVNLCYRSNRLEYRHLAFQFQIINQSMSNAIEMRLTNRRHLVELIRERMISLMSIDYLRLSQLELDHHSNQTLYCIFTLLDRTPFGNTNSEIGLIDAQEKLRNGINTHAFQFHTDDGLFIEAVPDSLGNIQYFSALNGNVSMNLSDYFAEITVEVNRTIIEKTEIIHEEIRYSNKMQLVAGLSGILVGILSGSILVCMVTYRIKRRANPTSTHGLAFRNISFHVGSHERQEDQATIILEHPIYPTENVIS